MIHKVIHFCLRENSHTNYIFRIMLTSANKLKHFTLFTNELNFALRFFCCLDETGHGVDANMKLQDVPSF